MASNVALFFLVIIFFITFSDKIECKKNKNEKISFFLTNHEITKIIRVPRRTSGPSNVIELDGEISFQFTAFEKTFVVDLTVFYPREDSIVDYISKLSNGTGNFLGYKLMIYQGYVRNIKDSSVLGYFGKNCPFRGYMMTDEIFSIEPYDSGTVIVYRFKDVITPGCSKKSGDEGLDCSDTRYFVPWKANNPPALRMPSNYELLYDKYFKFYRQKEAKRAELKRKNDEQKEESSTEKQHKCNHKNHKCENENEEGKEVENATETLKDNKNKELNFESKTEHSDKTTTATSVEEMKNAKHKNVNKKEKYTKRKADDLDVDYNKDKNNDKNKTLKDDERFTIPESTVANDFKRKVKRYGDNENLSDMKKESFEDTEILKKEVVKRGIKSRIGKSKVEA